MKKTKLFFRSLALLLLMVLLVPFGAVASAAGGNSLTLQYPCSGAEFRVYRVADASPGIDGSYTLVGDFAGLSVEVPGDSWRSAALELASHAAGISPDVRGEISGGSLTFSGLEDGLYLVDGNAAVSNGIRYTPVPFLVIVSGGSVLSQVKSDQEPVEEEPVSYQVKKVWKGDDADDRPGSVAIRLLRDGQLVETVTLNANNHWTYTWEDTPGHTWQAEEAQVPNGYQASVSQSGNTFTVTNTWKTPGEQPGTGDTTFALAALALLLTSAGAFVVIRRKNRA